MPVCGVGWSLEGPKVERVTRFGIVIMHLLLEIPNISVGSNSVWMSRICSYCSSDFHCSDWILTHMPLICLSCTDVFLFQLNSFVKLCKLAIYIEASFIIINKL